MTTYHHKNNYYFNPFSINKAHLPTQFSTSTQGPFGHVAKSTLLFNFTKSNPYATTGTGGNHKDPISGGIHKSLSEDWNNRIQGYYDEVEKTRRQLKFNTYSGSGNSYTRPRGFDAKNDYHRIVKKFQTRSMLRAAMIIGGAYLVLTKLA